MTRSQEVTILVLLMVDSVGFYLAGYMRAAGMHFEHWKRGFDEAKRLHDLASKQAPPP